MLSTWLLHLISALILSECGGSQLRTQAHATNIICCPENCNWPYGDCVFTPALHHCYKECRCIAGWSGIDCKISVHAAAPEVPKASPPFLISSHDFKLSIGWERISTSFRYPLFNSYVQMAYDPTFKVPYYPPGHPLRPYAVEQGWVQDYVPGQKGLSDADIDRTFLHLDMDVIMRSSGVRPPRIGEFGYKGEPIGNRKGQTSTQKKTAALLQLEEVSVELLQLSEKSQASQPSASPLPTNVNPVSPQITAAKATNMSALVWRDVYTGKATDFTFEDTWPETKFWFRIGHINAGGLGPPSDPVSFSTTGTTLNCVAGHACYKPPYDYPEIINGCLNLRAKSAALRNLVMRALKDPKTGYIDEDPLKQATGGMDDLGQFPFFNTVLNKTNVQDPATNITYTFSIDILDFCAGVDGICDPKRAREPMEELWPPEAAGWSASVGATAHAWVDVPKTQWARGYNPKQRLLTEDRPTFQLPWRAPKNCSSGNHWCKWPPFPMEDVYGMQLRLWQKRAYQQMASNMVSKRATK